MRDSHVPLADRGHKVTICLKASDKLGGAIKHADYIPFKWTLKDYKDYLIAPGRQEGTSGWCMNTRVTPDMMEDQYDVVIAAVGAEPVMPKHPRCGRCQTSPSPPMPS